MPTGYTNFIEEGKIDNARDFLKLCLRNFGIAIDYRDEPLSLEPLRFDKEENPIIKYYKDRLSEREKEKEDFLAKSINTIKAERIAELQKDISRYKECIDKYEHLKKVYDSIEEDVRSWECEDDFKNIKDFALQQISTSDCGWYIGYYVKEMQKCVDELGNIDGTISDYIEKKNKTINDSIEDCKEGIKKHSKTTDERKEFYNRFIESVNKI